MRACADVCAPGRLNVNAPRREGVQVVLTVTPTSHSFAWMESGEGGGKAREKAGGWLETFHASTISVFLDKER